MAMLHSYQQYLPINIAGDEKTVNRVLQETLIQTQPGAGGQVNHIPLSELLQVRTCRRLEEYHRRTKRRVYTV